jgi:hypothetical protein
LKVIAVPRGGTLEMHGVKGRRASSWTKLAETASKGATFIDLLEQHLDWTAGDEIVIASTDFNQ